MFAFPAARRTLVLMLSITLLASAVVAQAGDDHEKGYLGVILQDVTPGMAKALQMGDKTGVMINEVIDDSPAAKAGLEDGDVILEFNDKTISDNSDLTKAVRRTSPGEEVKVIVLRNGKNKTIEIEVGKHESGNVFFMSGDDDFTWTTGEDMAFGFNSDRGYMGVQLDDLNEQMGDFFGVEDGKGALVTEVVEDSPAAKAGLKAGDVIVRIGENEIDSSSSLHEAVGDTEPGQQMAVKVIRKGKNKELSITLGEMPKSVFSNNMGFTGADNDHFTVHTAPHGMHEADSELKEMREELHQMQKELKKIQEELKK